MGHQIRFQKAEFGLMPLFERADGNLLLEQRSRSRRREAMLTSFALRTEEAIRLLLHSLKAVGCDTPRLGEDAHAAPTLLLR